MNDVKLKWRSEKTNNSDVHEAVLMMVNKVIGKEHMMKVNECICGIS